PAATAEPEEAPAQVKRIPIDDFNFYSPEMTWLDYEKLIFAKAFSNADFKPAQAAKDLGVSPATFYKRIKDFDLQNKDNPVYHDSFVVPSGKTLREFLEDIVWAAFQCAEEKAYTAIKWLSVSQGHFYNVLREAKKKYQK
ncbi:MAG: hypothetical protein R3257_02440, partial [bacterium]|nr:hypothetical protein [bacterium]